MKVTRLKTTGVITYRSDPEFETGKGIKNSLILFRDRVNPNDLEEVEITQEEWDNAGKMRF